MPPIAHLYVSELVKGNVVGDDIPDVAYSLIWNRLLSSVAVNPVPADGVPIKLAQPIVATKKALLKDRDDVDGFVVAPMAVDDVIPVSVAPDSS